jgi:biopolymer transport protein ExbD
METDLILIITETVFMTTAQSQPTAIRNRKLHSLKIDMTPMVDLGFLLITFFIFTAALSEPTVTRLIMPKEGAETIVPQSHSLTLLLGEKKLFAYEGIWEEARMQRRVAESGYGLAMGAGDLIREKRQRSGEKLVVLIKPLAAASYENVVTMLDEMQISDVKKFAIVDAAPGEQSWAKNQQ